MLITPGLRQAAESYSSDHWALLGRDYIQTKSQLYVHQPEDSKASVTQICEASPGHNQLSSILAVMYWSETKSSDERTNLIDVLRFKCQRYDIFLSMPVQNLRDLIDNAVGHQHNANTVYQVTVLALAALSPNNILSEFAKIIRNPLSMLRSFLPTMPEHRFFVVPTAYRVEDQGHNSMYTCPNGHLYSIGDCTQPVQGASCPTCKEKIGGIGNYRAAAGNAKFTLTRDSQAGYRYRDDTAAYSSGSERMSRQGCAATKYILHSCLLAACLENRVDVAR